MPISPRRRAAGAALALVLCSGAARAENNPFGWHEHDGFYLRAATGLGPMNVSRRTKAGGSETSELFTGNTSSMRGLTSLLEVSAGGTPVERFVVAGTVLDYQLANAEVHLEDDSRVSLGTSFTLLIVALTTDIFPRPSGGFHFGGGLGYADGTATVQKAPGVVGGKGLGITACAGYGWWIEDDWSLGALVRGTAAFTAGHHASGDATGSETDTLAVVSLAITGLFH